MERELIESPKEWADWTVKVQKLVGRALDFKFEDAPTEFPCHAYYVVYEDSRNQQVLEYRVEPALPLLSSEARRKLMTETLPRGWVDRLFARVLEAPEFGLDPADGLAALERRLYQLRLQERLRKK